MAKINKYWGFVAVGALTAAAAGAIAAAFLKKHADPENFEFDEDAPVQDDSDEEPVKESKEVFQSWEPSSNEKEEDEAAVSSENAKASDESETSEQPKEDSEAQTEAAQEEETPTEEEAEIPVE